MKLIDKDKIIAEIERIFDDEEESIKSFEHRKNVSELQCHNTRINLLNHFLYFINTLEIKEVDLGKEIKRFTMSKELYEADSAIKAVAEHFFELGLKAQKG